MYILVIVVGAHNLLGLDLFGFGGCWQSMGWLGAWGAGVLVLSGLLSGRACVK